MALTTPKKIAVSSAQNSDKTAAIMQSFKRRRDFAGLAFKASLVVGMTITFAVLIVLLVQVVSDGSDVLTTRLGNFLTSGLGSTPELSGIAQGLRGTFYLTLITAIVAFPLGIASAVYLEEYAHRGRMTDFINLNIRNLAGVPSVVYGILGLTIFVNGWGIKAITGGRTPIAAGLTLAALVLPIVIITSAEAIRGVPSSLREAGYGVGATKSEVIKDHVLPYAAPGILTGTLLSVARAAGEAAPLILIGATTGFLSDIPGWADVTQAREPFTAMPIVIATWARQPQEGFKVGNAAAAIVVLVVFVLLVNAAAIYMRNRFERKRAGL